MKFIGALNLVELSEVVQLGDNKSSQHLFSVFGNWTENVCWVGTQSQLGKSELELGLIIGTRLELELCSQFLKNWNQTGNGIPAFKDRKWIQDF